MLEIRPNCEACDKDLPADSSEACICTYECTFCRACVDELLLNVCPNCGGGFVDLPIRPKIARREGVSLINQPASTARVHTKYSKQQITEFANAIRNIKPEDR
jgi:hypothetical protein